MEDIGKVLLYLRECHAANSSRQVLWNLFKADVAERLFFEGQEQLFSGKNGEIELEAEYGARLASGADLHQQEKSLVYGGMILVGPATSKGFAKENLCSPLFWETAEVVAVGDHFQLITDRRSRTFNDALLARLLSEERDWESELRERIGYDDLTREHLDRLVPCFEGLTGFQVHHGRSGYPQLTSENRLKQLARQARKEKRFLLIPAAFAALIPKPGSMRGVYAEIKEIAEDGRYSKPLETLLGSTRDMQDLPDSWSRRERVPAILSKPQKAIVEAAETAPLSVVIGPPGTGKTFTIAAVALEHFSRGESVLIASKMSHAVDAAMEKLSNFAPIEGYTIRAGRRNYRTKLKSSLAAMLRGMIPEADQRQIANLEKQLDKTDLEIQSLEAVLADMVNAEIRVAESWLEQKEGFFKAIKKGYFQFKSRYKKTLADRFEEMEIALNKRVELAERLLVQAFLKKLNLYLSDHRGTFQSFLESLGEDTGSLRDARFRDIDWQIIFHAFPIWLVDAPAVRDFLPLGREMFDVAIIDEASQCDLACCLPIIQRAKRVVIVGDPHQLRHVSFLAGEVQRKLASDQELDSNIADRLDFRNVSLLDLAESRLEPPRHAFFLNEYYRGRPPLIAFSNRRFYNQSLHVMSEKPGVRHDDALQRIQVSGTRLEEGYNPLEAQRLLDDVCNLIEHYRDLPGQVRTIGILSPFRAQADWLTKSLAERIPFKVRQKHRLVVGTAHAFQGLERDYMFISMCLDDAYHPGALRFLEKPDVFNVAVTRAAYRQFIYTSLDHTKLPSGSLLADYLSDLAEQTRHLPETATTSGHDPFLQEVAAFFEGQGCTVFKEHPLAGVLIDLVALKNGRVLAVDLVGYPGIYQDFLPVERYRMLCRAGLDLVPLSYSDWVFNRAGCEAFLIERLPA